MSKVRTDVTKMFGVFNKEITFFLCLLLLVFLCKPNILSLCCAVSLGALRDVVHTNTVTPRELNLRKGKLPWRRPAECFAVYLGVMGKVEYTNSMAPKDFTRVFLRT